MAFIVAAACCRRGRGTSAATGAAASRDRSRAAVAVAGGAASRWSATVPVGGGDAAVHRARPVVWAGPFGLEMTGTRAGALFWASSPAALLSLGAGGAADGLSPRARHPSTPWYTSGSGRAAGVDHRFMYRYLSVLVGKLQRRWARGRSGGCPAQRAAARSSGGRAWPGTWPGNCSCGQPRPRDRVTTRPLLACGYRGELLTLAPTPCGWRTGPAASLIRAFGLIIVPRI